jgi:DNA gyrase subunit A
MPNDSLFDDSISNQDSNFETNAVSNEETNIEANIVENIQDTLAQYMEGRVQTKILEEEMQSSYLRYAMSVIAARALPDVRDGLKPVHRRIIYVMEKMGLTPGAKYRKCAQVVGEVLGKYHPHGDTAVYDALVRMAQDFSLRYPLVDGQGNFGSVDGDSAAAMRYTESKMDKITPFLVQDIEKDTVDFVDNYDGTQREPRVLPAKVPNLLINGATGIAVGMATNIPPHNLGEVCQALMHLLYNPEASIEELAEFVKGPDLPTGGTIYGKEDILNAYKTGRGKCTMRSKYELGESHILITEIPYQVNKSDLVAKIGELVKDKKIEGIRDIRDESNKEGIRIMVETKRDASPEVILNQLFQQTDLQMNLHFNLLALVDKGRQPKLLNLKQILEEFIQHREEVIIRRTKFDLKKAEDELHILDGLKIALDFIDEVIKLIRGSADKTEAAEKLQERFNLSDRQVEAILQMRLQTLTSLDRNKIESERQIKITLIAELRLILESSDKRRSILDEELHEISAKFTSPRKTVLIAHSIDNYSKEDFIEAEDVLVQLTASQYMKVLPLDTFRQQGRGGRGITSFNPKDEDWVKSSLICNSHDYLYCFTNYGRVFKSRAFDLPSGSRTGRGQSLVNYLELKDGEQVTNILSLTKEQDTNKEGSLIFATKKGSVKRTNLDQFSNLRKTGIIAITLKEGDELVGVLQSLNEEDNIVLSANNGKTVIFSRTQLSALGRTAQGVRGMKLKAKEQLISLQVSDFHFQDGGEEEKETNGLDLDEAPSKEKIFPSLLVITEKGFGKQTYLADYRRTNRATSGVKTLNVSKKNGKPVLVTILTGQEESVLVTSKKGITIRVSTDDINQLGRNTQGIKVIKLEAGDEVMTGGIS